jgi:hypothetical protein
VQKWLLIEGQNKPEKANKLSYKNFICIYEKEVVIARWPGKSLCGHLCGQAKVFVAQKLKSFNVSRDPGDGWRRSDSGETREGTKASKTILRKDALLPYQKEK